MQVLSVLGIANAQQIEQAQCLQLWSMLDDWNAIAKHQLKTVMTTYIEPEQSL